MDLKEFFLLLSSTGLAYRRCILWCASPEIKIGVQFQDKDYGGRKNLRNDSQLRRPLEMNDAAQNNSRSPSLTKSAEPLTGIVQVHTA